LVHRQSGRDASKENEMNEPEILCKGTVIISCQTAQAVRS
jgi:hypothetical protein